VALDAHRALRLGADHLARLLKRDLGARADFELVEVEQDVGRQLDAHLGRRFPHPHQILDLEDEVLDGENEIARSAGLRRGGDRSDQQERQRKRGSPKHARLPQRLIGTLSTGRNCGGRGD
jgi:hypothetical protein